MPIISRAAGIAAIVSKAMKKSSVAPVFGMSRGGVGIGMGVGAGPSVGFVCTNGVFIAVAGTVVAVGATGVLVGVLVGIPGVFVDTTRVLVAVGVLV